MSQLSSNSPLFDEDGHPLTEGGARAGSAAAEKEVADKKRNNTIAVIAVVLLIGGIAFGLYKYVKSKKSKKD